MRTLKSVLVAVVAAVCAAVVTPAANADVTRGWGMEWGASQTEGTRINWTAGYSAFATGYIKAVSGKRGVCVHAENGNHITEAQCVWATNDTKHFTDMEFRIEDSGGVQVLYAVMYVEGLGRAHQVHCRRTGCTRDY